jgi:hypothetical protein
MCGGPGPHHIFGFNPFGGGISQQAGLGMQGMANDLNAHLRAQRGNDLRAILSGPPQGVAPKKKVCAYCGGPEYKEKSCQLFHETPPGK